MTDMPSLMEFPCEFLLKIIGKNSAAFETDVVNITRKHFPNTLDSAIRSQPSQQASYLAVSVTVYALDQVTLDALYLELTQHPDIKMVL